MTSTPQATSHCTFLIVGYGNPLRGDDGVGPQVARAVSDWQVPSVRALSVPQLLPEIAVELATANYVIFVDACGNSGASAIRLEPIVTTHETLAQGNNHACDPAALVALTHRLYGDHPQAWLLQIPIEHCDRGQTFSKTAKQGVDSALRTIEQFLTTYLRPAFTSAAPCRKSA